MQRVWLQLTDGRWRGVASRAPASCGRASPPPATGSRSRELALARWLARGATRAKRSLHYRVNRTFKKVASNTFSNLFGFI